MDDQRLKVLVAGAIWTGNMSNRSYLVVGGVKVSYAHVVYSIEGLSPTITAAHFQPLIRVEHGQESETD